MPKCPKIGITQPSDGLATLSKGWFDVKCGAEDPELLFVCLCGVFVTSFPKLP